MKPGTSLIIHLVLTTATVVVLSLGNVAAQRKTEPRMIARWDVQATGVTDDLTAVQFVNDNLGFAAGKNNTIIRTTDGGATWTGVTQEVSEITNKIRFASLTTGWAFGKNGSFVLASSDGGKTWKAQPTGLPDYRPPVDISVLSERQVFMCTTEAVLSTSNGGDSWKVIGNFRSETISALSFPDSNHGWVVGRQGFVSHYHMVPANQPR